MRYAHARARLNQSGGYNVASLHGKTHRVYSSGSDRSVYYLLILAVGIERLAELVVSKRNAQWSFAQGGREVGRGHYPVMVALHTALLLGCVVETWALHRPFIAWLGWPMLAIAVGSARRCAGGASRRWAGAGTPG